MPKKFWPELPRVTAAIHNSIRFRQSSDPILAIASYRDETLYSNYINAASSEKHIKEIERILKDLVERWDDLGE